ncbi:Restriction endonuclease, type II, XhoI, partial [mine drainage metagenome]
MPTVDSGIFSEAVRTFWGVRGDQGVHQGGTGRKDAGRRTEVTGGRHMNGFIETVSSLLKDSGVPPSTIFVRKGGVVLPGFFRATKQWDLLVVDETGLKAVIEFKAIVG